MDEIVSSAAEAVADIAQGSRIAVGAFGLCEVWQPAARGRRRLGLARRHPRQASSPTSSAFGRGIARHKRCRRRCGGNGLSTCRTPRAADPASRRFAVFHLAGDAVAAVETVNSAPEFMLAKKLIASSAHVDAGRLAAPSIALRDLAA